MTLPPKVLNNDHRRSDRAREGETVVARYACAGDSLVPFEPSLHLSLLTNPRS